MHSQTENGRIGEGLTFEKVWASIMELKESHKEIAQLIKETGLQMKETDRQIGELGNRFGQLAEHLVAPNILEKFNKLGFDFTRISNNLKIKEPDNPNRLTEVDIVLENGDIVIAVEIKASAKTADIDAHVKRLELLRRTADMRHDFRKYRGAVAVAIMNQNIRDYILQNGFYAIEQTGDTVHINIPDGFNPREW